MIMSCAPTYWKVIFVTLQVFINRDNKAFNAKYAWKQSGFIAASAFSRKKLTAHWWRLEKRHRKKENRAWNASTHQMHLMHLMHFDILTTAEEIHVKVDGWMGQMGCMELAICNMIESNHLPWCKTALFYFTLPIFCFLLCFSITFRTIFYIRLHGILFLNCQGLKALKLKFCSVFAVIVIAIKTLMRN